MDLSGMQYTVPMVPVVGQHVYLAGTGQWYQGEHFGAVVVDVRDSDGTVKVRFTDGGYKRYQILQYQELVQETKFPVVMPDTDIAVDLSSLGGPTGLHGEMKELHEGIILAVQSGDFLKADTLQKQYRALTEKHDQMHNLQIKLIDTVKRGEYLKAHEIQQSLTKLKRGEAVDSQASAPVVETPLNTQAPSITDIIKQAGRSAARGGMAGAAAMVLQVGSLMWMRTIMNYQYRYGMGTVEAAKTLYAEGGIRRFYRGIAPALIQGPVSRFGDTAANAGILALFEHNEQARNLPVPVKTVFSSAAAASMRILLVPVDTVKTMMQVEGKEGLNKLSLKYKSHGAPVFFHGAIATSSATFVGHYPWFTVFNTLQSTIPKQDTTALKLGRNALIGFVASATSDTVSNSLRVVKTVRQTNDTMPYIDIVKMIVKEDGAQGLFGRGLKTRLIANGAQGIMFSVLYKLFEEQFMKK